MADFSIGGFFNPVTLFKEHRQIGKIKEFEKDQEEFMEEFQSISRMAEGEQKDNAMRQFIAKDGASVEDPMLKSKMRQTQTDANAAPNAPQPNLADQFIEAGFGGMNRIRTSIDPYQFSSEQGGTDRRGGYDPKQSTTPSGQQFETANYGAKDVWGLGGVKLYDVQEIIEGKNVMENMLALKSEVAQYKNWETGMKNTIDKAFADGFIPKYLPKGITKESLLNDLANGDGTGLWYLLQGLEQSSAAGLTEAIVEDERSVNARKIKSEEQWLNTKRAIDYRHRLALQRQNARGGTSKDNGLKWNINDKLRVTRDVIENEHKSIVLKSGEIDGLLAEQSLGKMNDTVAGVGGIPLKNVELAYELDEKLAGADNKSAEAWEEEKNDIAQDYMEQYPDSNYAVVRNQIDAVTDMYKDIDPEAKTKIFGAVGSIETSRAIAKGAEYSFAIISARALVNPHGSNVNNVPELATSVEIIRTGDPTSPEYKEAERMLLDPVNYGLNGKAVSAALFLDPNQGFPTPETPPGAWENTMGTIGGAIDTTVEGVTNIKNKLMPGDVGVPEPSIATQLQTQVKSLADVWGNSDGRLSNAEIEDLSMEPQGIDIASKHIPAWKAMSPEQRKAALRNSQGE